MFWIKKIKNEKNEKKTKPYRIGGGPPAARPPPRHPAAPPLRRCAAAGGERLGCRRRRGPGSVLRRALRLPNRAAQLRTTSPRRPAPGRELEQERSSPLRRGGVAAALRPPPPATLRERKEIEREERRPWISEVIRFQAQIVEKRVGPTMCGRSDGLTVIFLLSGQP